MEVNVTLDNVPLPEAQVLINGVVYGITDGKGTFVTKLQKKPGTHVDLKVVAPSARNHVKPWRKVFKLAEPDSVGNINHTFDVTFHSKPTVTFVITDGAKRIDGASIRFDGEHQGATNKRGILSVSLPSTKKIRTKISVKKNNYDQWEGVQIIEAGEEYKVTLRKQPVLKVVALSEVTNIKTGISGLEVYLDKERIGTTDRNGRISYRYQGRSKKNIVVKIIAPGYMPSQWEGKLSIDKDIRVTRYFNKLSPAGVRIGILPFSVNDDSEDLKLAALAAQRSFENQLFSAKHFKRISRDKFMQALRESRLTKERIISRGWIDTPMTRVVDMVVIGKLYKGTVGYDVGITILTPSGQFALEQSRHIRGNNDLNKIVKRITLNIAKSATDQSVLVSNNGDRYMMSFNAKVPVGSVVTQQTPLSKKSIRATPQPNIAKIKSPTQKTPIKNQPPVLISLFKVDSTPAGAKVYVDEKYIGTTPLLQGVEVEFGFHTVKLIKEGFRKTEEVVDFSKAIVDRLGNNKYALPNDGLASGEDAEIDGSIEQAISAYRSLDRRHPDYAKARHRLAQLYLVYKSDYEAAVKEFEKVVEIPEVDQLIWKQFAVVYTNLGQAYYKLGESVLELDDREAAQYFAKAIKALDKAKVNTRFFPNDVYDEILHDTYYYNSLAYQALYYITERESIYIQADRAWRDYFDFFPTALKENSEYAELQDASQDHWDQLRSSR